MPDAVSLIQLKRDNVRPLTDAEIGWLFAAYAAARWRTSRWPRC